MLETTFEAAGGTVRLTDVAVAAGTAGHGGSKILRLVEGLGGGVDLEVTFRPTFDYARAPTSVEPCAGGAVATGDRAILALAGPVPLVAGPEGARGTCTVHAGDRFWLALGQPRDGRAPARLLDGADDAVERVVASQRAWAHRGTYDGPHRHLVERSAVTLSLLIHGPTGAPVAAPTASLPEALGGVRNWDYRYTWLRDAALGLRALQLLDYHDEAMAFWDWLATRSAEATAAGLQIAYRVDGRADLDEEELANLSGYCGSRPVRIGNAAAQQRQHDVAGAVLEAAWYCWRHMPAAGHPFGAMTKLADRVARQWREPDRGIWEIRSQPTHFLHSKLYSWVALDCAVWLARGGAVYGDAAGWARARDEVAAAILRHGVDPATGAFTRSFGSPEPDASSLTVPLVGFLPAGDARVGATVRAVRERLEDDGLLYRYLDDDGLPGREGAFLPCAFWLAEVLAMRGEWDEAHVVFERAAGCANDLGLLSEEVDPGTGAALGNFPQAFSHLALIRAALRLTGA